MRIAIACEGKEISEHFGFCKNFNIYEVEKTQILKFESIPNPEHKSGFLPTFLHNLGVNVVITGGIGLGAINLIKNKNIDVITGASGDSEKTIKMFLSNKLKSTNSICSEHKNRC